MSARAPRFIGVEWLRGLAAYGVIAIHGSLVCSNVSPAVAWLQHSFDTFVVPYFLAVSFYFAARGFSLQEPFWPWLQKRGRRLLLPYVLWTVIYTGLQIAQALPRHDRTARLAEVMGDPTGRFFVGGAGMALYFLPLLFVGLLEMRLLSRWFSARSPAGPLLAGLLFSLVAAIWLHATHNGFSTTRQTAFQPLLMQAVGGPWATRLQEFPLSRLLLVVVADGIGCLPFLFLAWLTAGRPADELPPRTRLAVIAGALLVLLLASGLFLPLPSVLPGFALLLLALAMTWPKFAEWWGLKVGACSFAIFLMHQALLELLRLALGSHFPGQPAPFFAVTIGVFAAAFALTYLVERTDWRFGRILLAL